MPDTPTRDEDLVRRYLSGDRAAFAALVERHERRVYNLALRMTGREEDARDATQDAFLTVLRKLSSFRGEAAFTTWLHRVTVNACYDLLRKRQRAPLLDRGEDDLPAREPPPAPDHHPQLGHLGAVAVVDRHDRGDPHEHVPAGAWHGDAGQ